MTLLLSNFGSASMEEVHIFLGGSLPECGTEFSVPSSCPDPGFAFTVNSCGAGSFLFKNTCDITLTVNAFETPVNAFLEKHLSRRTAHSVQKHEVLGRSSFGYARFKLPCIAVLRL